MEKIQRRFQVVVNEKISPRYYRLALDAGDVCGGIQPGQFVHIRVRDGLEPFLRRPFSVFRARRTLDVLYDVVGRGTQALSAVKKGDVLDVLGPLGNAFTVPDAGVKEIVMVAGGIGVAPFMLLSDVLRKAPGRKILLYGGRTKEHVLDFKAFQDNGCEVRVATEDGSVGVKGRVTELFPFINADPDATRVYTCGPRAMMAAVQAFAARYRLSGQASTEEVMACGLGACLGCAVNTVDGYKTACYDGPVFDLKDIVFRDNKGGKTA